MKTPGSNRTVRSPLFPENHNRQPSQATLTQQPSHHPPGNVSDPFRSMTSTMLPAAGQERKRENPSSRRTAVFLLGSYWVPNLLIGSSSWAEPCVVVGGYKRICAEKNRRPCVAHIHLLLLHGCVVVWIYILVTRAAITAASEDSLDFLYIWCGVPDRP